MNADFTPAEHRLLTGTKGHFFEACVTQLRFLVDELGYKRSMEDLGRCCYRVSFKREEPSGARLIRIYHEDEDLLWCDLEFSAAERKRIRLSQACSALVVDSPGDRFTERATAKLAVERVGQIARCLRAHLSDIERLDYESVARANPG